MNSELSKTFHQGNWHDSLCDELWDQMQRSPTARNIVLALDATHCIKGINNHHVDHVDSLIASYKLSHWQIVYRLCSFDIALGATNRLDLRLSTYHPAKINWFASRSLLKFPRVLSYLNQSSRSSLSPKLTEMATAASDLLSRTVPIENLIEPASSYAIVGNGPTLSTLNAGSNIDQHDQVIRFNNTGLTNKYDTNLGKKTHLWIVSPGLDFRNTYAPCDTCVITGPDPWTRPSRYWQSIAALNSPKLAQFEISRWHKLVKRLGAPPSAGTLVLDALRQAGAKRTAVSTFGFSRLEQDGHSTATKNHYSDNAAQSDRHNWHQEARLFQEW